MLDQAWINPLVPGYTSRSRVNGDYDIIKNKHILKKLCHSLETTIIDSSQKWVKKRGDTAKRHNIFLANQKL